MASNLIAMASNLIAMASNILKPNSDGLKPNRLEPLENGTPTQTTTRNQLSVKTAVSAKWQRLRPFYHLSQKYKCS